MLQTQTVSTATLELLKQLMAMPELNNFALVGGTNLSLQSGYRLSVDIDLFTNQPFDVLKVKEAISMRFDNAVRLDEMKQTIWYQIRGVKTDFILHEYPYLEPIREIDGIRFLFLPDIIPMKLGAVAGRGAKKDFWDIAGLLSLYTIKEMVGFYKRKYTSDDIGFILRALIYFDDANLQSDPVSLKKTTWDEVKKKIELAVKNI
jgi:hypothetical protein